MVTTFGKYKPNFPILRKRQTQVRQVLTSMNPLKFKDWILGSERVIQSLEGIRD